MDGAWIVAAVPEELEPMAGSALGIGPIAAAARMSSLLATASAAGRLPRCVVMVGSAGAYPGGPPIGRAVAASRIGWACGAAAVGLAYVPRAPEPIACDPRLVAAAAAAGLERHPVLTVAAVSTDPALVAAFTALGWSVEHMEAFAAAHACAAHGVPFLAVLGVANEVGPDAHAQWLAHRAAAQAAAVDGARAVIDG